MRCLHSSVLTEDVSKKDLVQRVLQPYLADSLTLVLCSVCCSHTVLTLCIFDIGAVQRVLQPYLVDSLTLVRAMYGIS